MKVPFGDWQAGNRGVSEEEREILDQSKDSKVW